MSDGKSRKEKEEEMIHDVCDWSIRKLGLPPKEAEQSIDKCTREYTDKLREAKASCAVDSFLATSSRASQKAFKDTCNKVTMSELLNQISNLDRKGAYRLLSRETKVVDDTGNCLSPIGTDPPRYTNPFKITNEWIRILEAQILKEVEAIERESQKASNEKDKADYIWWEYERTLNPLLRARNEEVEREKQRKAAEFKTWCDQLVPPSYVKLKNNFSKSIDEENPVTSDRLGHSEAVSPLAKGTFQTPRKVPEHVSKQPTREMIEIEDKKAEPPSFSKPTDTEVDFKTKLLKRGENEGLWRIREYVFGGSRMYRTAYGIDYEIISDKTGVLMPIEAKIGKGIIFTNAECFRFQNSTAYPKEVLRLCTIITKEKDPELANIVLYWSPSFFKILPNDAFTPTPDGKAFHFSLAGLQDCISQNKENMLFFVESERAELGEYGVTYKGIPMNEAYNWLYSKIKETMRNPLEELEKEYKPCPKVIPIQTIIRGKIDKIIRSIIPKNYRPTYSADTIPYILADSSVKDKLKVEIEDDEEVFYFGGKTLSTYLRIRIKSITKKESAKYEVIQIPNYVGSSYGVKGREYIPLRAGSSHLLDILKEFYDGKQKTKFLSAEVGNFLKIPVNAVASSIWNHGEELVNNNLVIFETPPKPKPIKITLTKLCIEYITRSGRFKI